MAHTLHLELPENLYRLLVETAERAGKSPETLATEQLMAMRDRHEDDPVESFIGAFASTVEDWVDRHDAHLGETAQSKLERGRRET